MNDEHPILMNGEMVRAILEGRKTQTRRPVTPKPDAHTLRMYHEENLDFSARSGRWYAEYSNCGRLWTDGHLYRCPFGKVGDRLWVREAFAGNPDGDRPYIGDASDTIYRADYSGPYESPFWSPSIHMPRTACRLVLRVEWVRVERVQDISDEDAEAEGVVVLAYSDVWASEVFAGMWDAIYGARGLGWQANPWVWVCGFSVAERKEPER